MDEKDKLCVDGYLFSTETDAAIARDEIKRIEYIEARMDYTQPLKVLTIFRKLLQERIFRTPIGFSYLKKLRDCLLEDGIEEKAVPKIPLYLNFSGELRRLPEEPKRAPEVKPKSKEDKKDKLFISIFLNCLLVLAVIAMFLIALNSDYPNMINYKQVLTNRYSSWEQELKDREEAIRLKEKELFGQEWKD